jgi:drug/metabolite transporter (DMT)-like permease
MPIQAILLILAAAVIHATWNFHVKKVGGGDTFLCMTSLISSIVLIPPVLYFYSDAFGQLTRIQWAVIVASGLLHMAYAMQLQRAYAAADLSVVYPLARGSGPLLTVFAAVIMLGERPSVLGWLGVAGVVCGAMIIGGVDKIARGGLHNPRTLLGVRYGLMTGLWIAIYSFVDGYAVKVLAIAPLVLDWLGNIIRAACLSPIAWRNRSQIKPLWQRAWLPALVVGALAPTSYILVLTALQYAPLSAVAPARELSMLIGAFMGAKLLAEGEVRRRMMGAALIAAGVAGLALG